MGVGRREVIFLNKNPNQQKQKQQKKIEEEGRVRPGGLLEEGKCECFDNLTKNPNLKKREWRGEGG